MADGLFVTVAIVLRLRKRTAGAVVFPTEQGCRYVNQCVGVESFRKIANGRRVVSASLAPTVKK